MKAKIITLKGSFEEEYYALGISGVGITDEITGRKNVVLKLSDFDYHSAVSNPLQFFRTIEAAINQTHSQNE